RCTHHGAKVSGFPPLEAMAAGCPALVSNTSCLPEICLDAPFYFNPKDQGSLETTLLEATNDEKTVRRAQERGTQVAAQYSRQKCCHLDSNSSLLSPKLKA